VHLFVNILNFYNIVFKVKLYVPSGWSSSPSPQKYKFVGARLKLRMNNGMHPPDMPSRSAQGLHLTGKSVCVCYTTISIICNRLKQDQKTALMDIGEG